VISKQAWLGAAERIVFNAFRGMRRLRQPLFNSQSAGLAILAYSFRQFGTRPRQEYNNILHQNSSSQAHFGRSGLHMLAYDPSEADSMLYVFDEAGRAQAKLQLHDDIPRMITNYGRCHSGVAISMRASTTQTSPRNMLDINSAIIDNPTWKVHYRGWWVSAAKANTIRISGYAAD